MSVPTQAEVLAYARKLRSVSVNMPRGEMRELLEARFLHNQDYFASRGGGFGSTIGAVDNPIDWLKGGIKILSGVKSWFDGDETAAVRQVIDGVLIILY